MLELGLVALEGVEHAVELVRRDTDFSEAGDGDAGGEISGESAPNGLREGVEGAEDNGIEEGDRGEGLEEDSGHGAAGGGGGCGVNGGIEDGAVEVDHAGAVDGCAVALVGEGGCEVDLGFVEVDAVVLAVVEGFADIFGDVVCWEIVEGFAGPFGAAGGDDARAVGVGDGDDDEGDAAFGGEEFDELLGVGLVGDGLAGGGDSGDDGAATVELAFAEGLAGLAGDEEGAECTARDSEQEKDRGNQDEERAAAQAALAAG